MKKFKDLVFESIDDGFMIGKKCRIFFENGYGASIVSHNYSYGGRVGLYEIAVLDKDGHITYETSVTNDVIGHLSEQEVDDVLEQIQTLKPHGN
jgi:hypothetical protein